MQKSRTTVKDVALKAGVSTSTVSRVISDNPRISKETKERVFKVMDELNYHPNAIARSLAKSKTKIIGVIIPYRNSDTLLNPFFPEALRGIIKRAKEFGYDVLLSSNQNEKDELNNIKSFIHQGKVDGIVLMTVRKDDEKVDYLLKQNFPFSVIGSVSYNNDLVNGVDNNNEKAAFDLTQMLVDLNRRDILFISGENKLTVSEKRLDGYKMCLKKNGISYKESNVLSGNFDEETGNKFGVLISKMKKLPSAIIATDDVIAYGIVKTLTEKNIKVPKDIMVASFNNSLLSRYSDIGITSVDVNSFKLGTECISVLIDAIDKNVRGKRLIIDHTIIKRESTEE